MFVSSVTNNLDAKGRISVPANFRTQCASVGFEGIVLWPSLDGAYLEGGDQSILRHYQDMLDQMDMYDPGREALELVIFGESETLTFDSTGRVSLPAKFREYAGLDGKVTFVGRGRKFEIWDEGAHEARRTELKARALANRHRMKPV
ncbi:transcriptional regulator MraZ [Litorimonas cladophorae]|uniref:Transcriptional regulator MraZ n=1 Tax=Litorimonas cladophorae TaxID=1220491 RepID=A0A918KEW8_9PROT|nr:division/cell wall cluster transcriptional repressor MraZ [Litorimonas cladophorae]GGX60998.1 transcriptional regulator MraZ [Litorimonas cladophorae]